MSFGSAALDRAIVARPIVLWRPMRTIRCVNGPVSTILTPAERHRVDAAGQGLYRTLHRDSIVDVVRDVRENRAAAILVSVARIEPADASHVASVVRQFPGVPAVALLTELQRETPHAVLSLGRCGVKLLIDARSPDGWRSLRQALSTSAQTDFGRTIITRLTADLADAREATVTFFTTLFTIPTSVTTVRALCAVLHTRANAFATRFHRLGLPSPRRYLTAARLTRAAHLFENPGLSIANVANALDYSSPQSLGRTIRTTLAMTPTAFRQAYDGLRMFDHFREELLLPYRQRLRRFDPVP